MMRLTNGQVVIQKKNYALTLDFQPWLDKLLYEQYVLVHGQERPVGQESWGVLSVKGDDISYCEATKVESCQPHTHWKMGESGMFVPRLAIVYPACLVYGQPKGILTIESIGFNEGD